MAGLMQVMATQGYDGTSAQTIAEAAGLSPGLVHHHFGKKGEVLLASIEVLRARVRSRFERRAEHATSLRGRSYAFIDAHLALGTDASPDAVACWVGIGAGAVRDEQRASTGVPEMMSAIYGAYQLASAARAAPKGFAASAVRRTADGLISAQRRRT